MTDPVEIFVLDKNVRLLQPAQGFRTSLDSVMLAAACPATGSERVLDMGCGVGGAAFCLLHRVPGLQVTGVDIQRDYIELAKGNIALNNKTNRIGFVTGDIRTYEAAEPFDHVICNPPYLEAGHHTPSPSEGLARARGHDEAEMSVKDWVDAGFRQLRSGGSLTVIHRADAVDRIIAALGRRFGAVEIIPLWPHQGENAKRVIVRARKDRKTPAILHAGIVLHNSDGSYTGEAERILRGAAPIL
jgi:tRNA1(Val) A37 N6-methylase TrmN6